MKDKNYVDINTFTLGVSKHLDMKGNKVIHIADLTSTTDGSNQRYVDTKTSNYLKTESTRVMTGNLNMNSRSIINVETAHAHESTQAADVNSVNTTINNSNKPMITHHQKYVND